MDKLLPTMRCKSFTHDLFGFGRLSPCNFVGRDPDFTNIEMGLPVDEPYLRTTNTEHVACRTILAALEPRR